MVSRVVGASKEPNTTPKTSGWMKSAPGDGNSLASEKTSRSLKNGDARLSHQQTCWSTSSSPMVGHDRVRRRSLKGQESAVGVTATLCPTGLTRHALQKNGSPFPPEVILGGFLLISLP